jgi:hypothetical protein
MTSLFCCSRVILFDFLDDSIRPKEVHRNATSTIYDLTLQPSCLGSIPRIFSIRQHVWAADALRLLLQLYAAIPHS